MGDTGAVSLFQAFADGPAGWQIHSDAGLTKLFGKGEGGAFGITIHRHDRHARHCRFDISKKHRKTFDASGPSNAGNRWPAEHFGQPVVAAAAKNRSLRPKRVSNEFKGGMAVVIQPSHQKRVEHPSNAGSIKRAGHAVEMPARVIIQIFVETRCRSENVKVPGIL